MKKYELREDVSINDLKPGDLLLEDAVQDNPERWCRIVSLGPCKGETEDWVQITTTTESYGIERDIRFLSVMVEVEK